MEPAIIVHGGCGEVTPEDRKPLRLQQLKASVVSGMKLMTSGGSSLDAVEAAVSILEDSPLFNAGTSIKFHCFHSITVSGFVPWFLSLF